MMPANLNKFKINEEKKRIGWFVDIFLMWIVTCFLVDHKCLVG
jgi:hypothetical protein